MNSHHFRVPVRLQQSAGVTITEVYSADEALAFLMAWPMQSGPLYDNAVSECFGATLDVTNANEAQRAFVAFARVSGILAKDMMAQVIEGDRSHHAASS